MNPDQNEIKHLRAISHPVKWRVLQALWSGRTLTATQAADIAGITPSAMSYHLRHLAKLGMIERLESDDGRERGRDEQRVSEAPPGTEPDDRLDGSAEAGEGRERAKARSLKMGRKLKLTKHQRQEALRRRENGETIRDIARSYNVSHSTISRLVS